MTNTNDFSLIERMPSNVIIFIKYLILHIVESNYRKIIDKNISTIFFLYKYFFEKNIVGTPNIFLYKILGLNMTIIIKRGEKKCSIVCNILPDNLLYQRESPIYIVYSQLINDLLTYNFDNIYITYNLPSGDKYKYNKIFEIMNTVYNLVTLNNLYYIEYNPSKLIYEDTITHNNNFETIGNVTRILKETDIGNVYTTIIKKLKPINNKIQITNNSWYILGRCPSFIDFEDLWNLHPEQYGTVKMLGKIIQTPRWQQTYGRNYIFSGINHEQLPIPKHMVPYLNFVNSLGLGEFNQILINWYLNGEHYIGKHSDDTRPLVKLSPIVSFSYGETRIFRIRKKTEKGIFLDIPLENESMIIMGGDFQNEFTHEIVKITGKKAVQVGRRINITFRQFQ